MAGYTIIPGNDAAAHLSVEAEFSKSVGDDPKSLFYISRPSIIVGRYNKLEEWVNLKAAAQDKIPVLRRDSGGGTAYHDLDTLCYSFLIPRAMYESRRRGEPPMSFFSRIVISALRGLGVQLSPSRSSDLCLNGYKVSGNAARLTSYLAMFHGTLLMAVDFAALERYLPVPPNRPGIPHREFVTSLRDQGINIPADSLMSALADALERVLAADIQT